RLDGQDPVDNEAVALALTAADLVVDVNGSLVEESAACTEVLDQARVLALDIDGMADLDHLVAHPGLARRLDAADAALRAGSAMRVSSETGTNLTMSIGEASTRVDNGVAATKGTLAHWPAGAVWTRPKRSTIVGCIVAMPGDLVVEAGHVLRSPVRIEIESGKVTDVLGDSADADVVRSQLESLDDDRAYDIAEVGWGMSVTRRSGGIGPFDAAFLAPGRGLSSAGRVNVRAGSRSEPGVSVTFSLASTSVDVDGQDSVADGSLIGPLAPDVYERTAGT
ncbi:MAG: hypothetical protein AAF480_20465, partial [Actinomycetota bacterium]